MRRHACHACQLNALARQVETQRGADTARARREFLHAAVMLLFEYVGVLSVVNICRLDFLQDHLVIKGELFTLALRDLSANIRQFWCLILLSFLYLLGEVRHS